MDFLKEDFAASVHYQVTQLHCLLRGWPQVQDHTSLWKVRLTWQTPT